MNWNKNMAMGIMAALLLGNTAPALAAEAAPAAEAEQAQTAKLDYTYTSKEYGFTIQCPQRPNVIPASLLYEGKKGEVLVFDNDGYNIKNAWVILTDAFDGAKTPDFNKINEEEAKKYLTELMNSNAYEGITLVNLSATNKAVYAVTAKEVEVDTDGDGKYDAKATADTQMAVTFFRGNKGGCYSIQLIDNPVLRGSEIKLFQQGVASFQE
ncbi:hypothetical protein SAMN02910356_01901 [Selenomonas sp. GACV-9]|uniref:hypothetical protein n=1 Tax=Selenomonas sp. GACV-9 TaxID=3158782 RepID=UPI0008F1715E|nr:hypothetical protein SAMN02910356_01901 [Selenomonas ruminantium]